MRVLVTGHNGYIGSVMVKILQSAGHEVVGLDTYFFANGGRGEKDGTFAICKDVRDVLPADLAGIEAVVHLAALCNDPLGDLNSDWTFEINHVASRRLAALSREAGVRRFLYASSCSMYGQAGEETVAEDAPLCPLTPYAISKVHAERDISSLADANFSPVLMRNATAYGMSPRLRGDVLVNNLVCWACTTGTIRITSDGEAWRPVVHVEDIAQAFCAALVAPRAAVHNEAFNVGTNEQNYQVRDLAEIVRNILPGCEIEYIEGGAPDPRSYRVNFDKLARLLPAFTPKWNVRRGAREVYDGIRGAAMTLDDFRGPKLTRLAQFKKLLGSGLLDNTLRWKGHGEVSGE
jgi:nucleoside-diphosphate-sugar epimerase